MYTLRRARSGIPRDELFIGTRSVVRLINGSGLRIIDGPCLSPVPRKTITIQPLSDFVYTPGKSDKRAAPPRSLARAIHDG